MHGGPDARSVMTAASDDCVLSHGTVWPRCAQGRTIAQLSALKRERVHRAQQTGDVIANHCAARHVAQCAGVRLTGLRYNSPRYTGMTGFDGLGQSRVASREATLVNQCKHITCQSQLECCPDGCISLRFSIRGYSLGVAHFLASVGGAAGVIMPMGGSPRFVSDSPLADSRHTS